MKNEYIAAINEKMILCNDLSLLDLIFRILAKATQERGDYMRDQRRTPSNNP